MNIPFIRASGRVIVTGLAMASLSLFVALSLRLPEYIAPSLLLMASAIVVYGLDHARDAESRGHFNPLAIPLLAVPAITSVALLLEAPPTARVVFATYMIIGFLYNLKIIPVKTLDGWSKSSLKRQASILKHFFVGGTITLGVVCLPSAWNGVWTQDTIRFALWSWIICSGNAFIFDLWDMEKDRENDVRTFPIILGKNRSGFIMILWLCVIMPSLLFSFRTEKDDWTLVILPIIEAFFILIVCQGSKRPFKTALDLAMSIPLILLLLAR